MWFPRPKSRAGVTALGGGNTELEEMVFQILHSTDFEEWSDKVGKAGRENASAKPWKRLGVSGNWVLKADLSKGTANCRQLYAEYSRAASLSQSLDMWHPSKQWVLLQSSQDGLWYPLTICRRLQTLREIPALESRMRSWSMMLEKSILVGKRYSVGLDVNPSNFGFESGSDHGPIYYIDDETYASLNSLEIANAIVARIPEEPGCEPGQWCEWGRSLQHTLQGLLADVDDWRAFSHQLEGYPLTPRFEAAHRALLDGLRDHHPLLDRKARSRKPPPQTPQTPASRLTCVFGDVHANLPALEAVLAAAQRAGADSYLFLGDAVGYGPHPKQCIERLAALDHALFTRGNHDQAVGSGIWDDKMNRVARISAQWTFEQLNTSERNWLSSLPLEHGFPDWLALHGAPCDPQRLFAYVYELTFRDNLDFMHQQGIPLCFHGHSHVQCAFLRMEDGTKLRHGNTALQLRPAGTNHLVNPGSVGQPRDGEPSAAFALWDRQAGTIRFERTPYSLDSVVRDLKSAGLPGDLAYRLEAGR